MLAVKVPEGSIKLAVQSGLKEEFIAYLKLKTVNIQGYYEFGVGVRAASSKLCISERTVRRWIAKLYHSGMMYKDVNGYGLIAYDKLFKLIGLDITPHKRKKRLGSFKIFKIKSDNINVTEIAKEEIKLNQSRQAYMIKRKSTPSKITDNNVGVVRGISLSCSGLANLCGYKKSSGLRIEQKLKARYPNTVSIDRCVEVVNTSSSGKSNMRRHYIENGVLFKIMANRIFIH